MCGIVGYIGTKKAVPILINGLEAVEYRGYDSAGVCLGGEKLLLKKAKGPVAALKKKIDAELNVNRGIAHTRWATHGRPDEKNAHPHMDCGQSLALVHNGIIENFLDLKKKLSNGHKIVSDTDSEILVHLIEEEMMIKGDSLSAVISALRKVKGSYALAIIGEKNSNELLVAKMGSPLVVGESDDGFYVASDVNALAGYVKKVLYLQDGDVALISNQRFLVKDLENKTVKRFWKKMLVQSTDIQKGGYKFFMEKEIREQPEILRRLIKQDIINKNTGNIKKAGEILAKARKVRISACGSAYYAGLTGKYFFENIASIPTTIDTAGEFRYQNNLFFKKDVALFVSQSGETADTIGALSAVKEFKIPSVAIVNMPHSSIARASDVSVLSCAGAELGVASTKAFSAQVMNMLSLSLLAAKIKGVKDDQVKAVRKEVQGLPTAIDFVFKQWPKIASIAQTYKNMHGFYFLGRGILLPIAYEGALKLKEISYIHAEGYPLAEMKHGPIALIDKQFAAIVLLKKGELLKKGLAAVEEIRARGGKVIAVSDEEKIIDNVDELILLPDIDEMIAPILFVLPLQILAYEVALAKGLNPDRPRNLAKSVTVE